MDYNINNEPENVFLTYRDSYAFERGLGPWRSPNDFYNLLCYYKQNNDVLHQDIFHYCQHYRLNYYMLIHT